MSVLAKLKGGFRRSESNGEVPIAGKIQEEEKEEFKARQRRRSSVVMPIALSKGIRRASTISTSSTCRYIKSPSDHALCMPPLFDLCLT